MSLISAITARGHMRFMIKEKGSARLAGSSSATAEDMRERLKDSRG
jgi:hypothetical protein